MRIRKGDQVIVSTGDDSSKQPRVVLSVLEGGDKIVVEGVNRVYKHVKKGHPKSPQGGRLSLEMPIDVSNVAVYCAACSSGTRVGARYLENGAKERFCKKCSTTLGVISPPRPKYAKKA